MKKLSPTFPNFWPRPFFTRFLLYLLAAPCLTSPLLSQPLKAQTHPEPHTEETIEFLKGLSIEELLQTEITTASKKSERLIDVAAAITVLSQEDLQRAGVNSLPEALRLVPGVQVAQMDSSRYAITIRGFNSYFANKLLVLIDGRSVYTPLFSGVYWNAQDTMIEDIDRIEVIRGPGAAVWGANAVNGVINIITKNSGDTQGGLLSVVAGDYITPQVSTRYGGTIDKNTSYRVYAKGFKRQDYPSTEQVDNQDGWQSIRTGFRLDRSHSADDTIMVSAEAYDNEADILFSLPSLNSSPGLMEEKLTEDYRGGHLLVNWKHKIDAQSTTETSFYFDHTQRDQDILEEERNTFDAEFKHHWKPNSQHDIIWGLGYRWTTDDIGNTVYTSFSPSSESYALYSAFIQDDIMLIPDTFWITLGSRLEHNDFTDTEFQPSLRFRYKPQNNQTIWGALSRAVRTPSRAERDINVYLGGGMIPVGVPPTLTPFEARLLGNDDFDSETLVAAELGYRWQPKKNLSLDIATFYNDYDDLAAFEPGDPVYDPATSTLLLANSFDNALSGYSYGAELSVNWQPLDILKLTAGYSFIDFDLDFDNPETGASSRSLTGADLTPDHQFLIRSSLQLRHDLLFDSEVYYVDSLDKADIDSYWRLDLQLSWQATDDLSISVGAENFLNSQHQEFPVRSNIIPSQVPDQYWLKATYSF